MSSTESLNFCTLNSETGTHKSSSLSSPLAYRCYRPRLASLSYCQVVIVRRRIVLGNVSQEVTRAEVTGCHVLSHRND